MREAVCARVCALVLKLLVKMPKLAENFRSTPQQMSAFDNLMPDLTLLSFSHLEGQELEVVGAIPIGVKQRPMQPLRRITDNIISVGFEKL